MKTSFHIGGFWFHVEWRADGKIGTDQHGRKWHNKDNPHTDTGVTEIICQQTNDVVKLLASLKSKRHDQS